MEQRLSSVPYFAGDSYSIADMVIFVNAYSLPLNHDYAANEKISPHFMEWLRRVYARPAVQQAFDYGRTSMRDRAAEMLKRFNLQE